MPLINCQINLALNWSANFVICEVKKSTAFKITYTKFYVPKVTFSTQDNTSLQQNLKSGFKVTINWKKYQSKVKRPQY